MSEDLQDGYVKEVKKDSNLGEGMAFLIDLMHQAH